MQYKYNSVLFIDDNEMDNFINEKMVESHLYAKNIYVCTDGKSALDYINNLLITNSSSNKNYPDIIFVDLNMPIMDGFEFIEHFKKIVDPKLLACRIVILTSSINKSDKIKAGHIGNDIIFVNKPLTNQILDQL